MDEPEKPDWTYWLDRADVYLVQAVELSCGVAPGWLKSVARERYLRTDFVELKREIEKRLSIAHSHIDARRLKPTRVFESINPLYGDTRDTFVDLSDFRKWGESLHFPFTFPEEFPNAAPHGEVPGQQSTPWPWGNHEPPLLRHLASAGKRFWQNYDPNDSSTAATNETVSAWLKDQGVAQRVAEVMAQILRAEGLKTGPR